jgi:hypothetical protein
VETAAAAAAFGNGYFNNRYRSGGAHASSGSTGRGKGAAPQDRADTRASESGADEQDCEAPEDRAAIGIVLLMIDESARNRRKWKMGPLGK